MGISLKPVFIDSIMLLRHIPLKIILTPWLSLILIVICLRIDSDVDIGFIAPTIFSFAIISIAVFVCNHKQYDNTRYDLFDDRLEIITGLLSIQKRTILIKNIREVTVHQGVLQKRYGLGDIYLNASAISVNIIDVKNPEDIYHKIKIQMNITSSSLQDA